VKLVTVKLVNTRLSQDQPAVSPAKDKSTTMFARRVALVRCIKMASVSPVVKVRYLKKAVDLVSSAHPELR